MTTSTSDGAQVLHYAVEGGNSEVVQLLIDAGAYVNAGDNEIISSKMVT